MSYLDRLHPDADIYLDSLYRESHRYYHNIDHYREVIDNLTRNPVFNTLNESDQFALYVAAQFHDVVYDPRSNSNESNSIVFCLNYYGKEPEFKLISDLIISTKSYNPKTNNDPYILEYMMMYADIKPIIDNDIIKLISNYKKILKEYQFVEYLVFRTGHLKIMKKLIPDDHTYKLYEKYVNSYRPSVAIYAGSFNPFHIGHKSVLWQADKIYDKVIIAQPNTIEYNVKNALPYHEVIRFSGPLHEIFNDYWMKYFKPLTIVRGLRNGIDLEYEVNLKKIYTDLGMERSILFSYFITEYPHVSSSIIRSMIKDGIDWDVYKVRGDD